MSGGPTRALGASGVRLTTVGFGGAPLGNLFDPVPPDVAQATLRAAWDAGVRYFDTAPLYGHGLSEIRLGEALATRPRDSYVLATKVGRLLRPVAGESVEDRHYKGTPPVAPIFDFSYDGVALNGSGSMLAAKGRFGLSVFGLVPPPELIELRVRIATPGLAADVAIASESKLSSAYACAERPCSERRELPCRRRRAGRSCLSQFACGDSS
jgi:hypothetical protein